MSLFVEIEFINARDKRSYLKNFDLQLHDHLADQADWDAEFWDFDPEYLVEYSKKIEEVISYSNDGIEFQALWVGENPSKFIELSPNAFLELIRTNKIGTSTHYFVNKNV